MEVPSGETATQSSKDFDQLSQMRGSHIQSHQHHPDESHEGSGLILSSQWNNSHFHEVNWFYIDAADTGIFRNSWHSRDDSDDSAQTIFRLPCRHSRESTSGTPCNGSDCFFDICFEAGVWYWVCLVSKCNYFRSFDRGNTSTPPSTSSQERDHAKLHSAPRSENPPYGDLQHLDEREQHWQQFLYAAHISSSLFGQIDSGSVPLDGETLRPATAPVGNTMENRLGELESSPDYSQYPAPYIRHGRGDLLHSGDPFLNTSLPSCRYGEESSSQSPEDLLTPEQYAPGRSAAIPPSIHLLRGRDGIGYPSSGHLLGEIPMSSTASSVSAEEGMTPVFQGSMLSGSSAVRRIPRSLPYEGDRPESQDERLLVKPHETTADAQADAKDLPRPTIGAPNTIAGNIDASPASNVAEGILEPAIAEVHVHFALASSSQTIEIQPATPPTSRGNLLCPYVGCPRANPGNGFVRGDNLRTHRRTVHGEDIPRIRYPRRIG